jgi:hypothetical protein
LNCEKSISRSVPKIIFSSEPLACFALDTNVRTPSGSSPVTVVADSSVSSPSATLT